MTTIHKLDHMELQFIFELQAFSKRLVSGLFAK